MKHPNDYQREASLRLHTNFGCLSALFEEEDEFAQKYGGTCLQNLTFLIQSMRGALAGRPLYLPTDNPFSDHLVAIADFPEYGPHLFDATERWQEAVDLRPGAPRNEIITAHPMLNGESSIVQVDLNNPTSISIHQTTVIQGSTSKEDNNEYQKQSEIPPDKLLDAMATMGHLARSSGRLYIRGVILGQNSSSMIAVSMDPNNSNDVRSNRWEKRQKGRIGDTKFTTHVGELEAAYSLASGRIVNELQEAARKFREGLKIARDGKGIGRRYLANEKRIVTDHLAAGGTVDAALVTEAREKFFGILDMIRE